MPLLTHKEGQGSWFDIDVLEAATYIEEKSLHEFVDKIKTYFVAVDSMSIAFILHC